METNSTIMKTRTNVRVAKITEGGGSEILGGTSYTPQGVEFFIPRGDRSIDRLVRKHEALHSMFSDASPRTRKELAKQFHEVVLQIGEDLRLHLCCQQRRTIQDCRDEITVGAREVRAALRSFRKLQSGKSGVPSEKIPDEIGVSLLRLTRGLALFQSGMDGIQYCRVHKSDEAMVSDLIAQSERIERKLENSADIIPEASREAMRRIINRLREDSAAFLFAKARTTSSPMSPMMRIYAELESLSGLKIPPKPTSPTTSPTSPNPQGDGEEKEGGPNHRHPGTSGAETSFPQMEIRDCREVPHRPRIRACAQHHHVSGPKIDARRLVQAVLQPGSLPFLRTVRKPGGSILIDISGSMNWSLEQIQTILDIAPASVIGLYDGEKNNGVLRIVAANGRRTQNPGTLEPFLGGNDIDLPALRWLLKQSDPRIIITDGDFCGKNVKAAIEASRLLVVSQARGKLHWIRKVDECIQFMQSM